MKKSLLICFFISLFLFATLALPHKNLSKTKIDNTAIDNVINKVIKEHKFKDNLKERNIR
jgi:hypothetical protein